MPSVVPSQTLPCCAPKLDPVMVTRVPAGPLLGETPVMAGTTGVVGGVTMTRVLVETLLTVAVIVAVPAAKIATAPRIGSTDAMDELEVFQVTEAVRSLELPSE